MDKLTKYAPVLLVVGLILFGLGLYLAPNQAYKLQKVFREYGQIVTGTIESKNVVTKTFSGGGRRRGKSSYTERVMDVRLPDGQLVYIDDLILSSDYKRLSVGSSVEISAIDGASKYEAQEFLPDTDGPFHLLKSSVDAGAIELVPWAFQGRPASGLAIAFMIPAIVFLLLAVALIWDSRRSKTRP